MKLLAGNNSRSPETGNICSKWGGEREDQDRAYVPLIAGYSLNGVGNACFYFRKMHEDPSERAPP